MAREARGALFGIAWFRAENGDAAGIVVVGACGLKRVADAFSAAFGAFGNRDCAFSRNAARLFGGGSGFRAPTAVAVVNVVAALLLGCAGEKAAGDGEGDCFGIIGRARSIGGGDTEPSGANGIAIACIGVDAVDCCIDVVMASGRDFTGDGGALRG